MARFVSPQGRVLDPAMWHHRVGAGQERGGTGDNRTGGVDHVVDHHGDLSLDVADHRRYVHLALSGTNLVEDGEVAAEHLSEASGQLRAPGIRRNADQLPRAPGDRGSLGPSGRCGPRLGSEVPAGVQSASCAAHAPRQRPPALRRNDRRELGVTAHMQHWDLTAANEGSRTGPRVLFSTPEARGVVMDLAQDEEMGDHQVRERALIHILRGSVTCMSGVDTTTCVEGTLTVFEPGEPHRLRALQPTHVIVNVDENEAGTVDALRGFVPHIVVTHPNAPEDNLALYALMGALFGAESRAEELCESLRRELAACREKKWLREQALYLIWKAPWMTIAADTYIARTLAYVGWDVTTPPGGWAGSARYPKVDDIVAAANSVDRVLLSTEPYLFTEDDAASLRAQVAVPVQRIDAEMTSWYGSRAIPGLAYLRRLRAASAIRA
jgi:quercetin dioxygenase-like cupin family protein